MKEPDLFDAAASRAERDEAVERVATKAGRFMDRGMEAVRALPRGEYTGEDVRRILTMQGVTPHHHNAWGALITDAVRSGTLRATGVWRKMTSVRSHARKTPVYVRE